MRPEFSVLTTIKSIDFSLSPKATSLYVATICSQIGWPYKRGTTVYILALPLQHMLYHKHIHVGFVFPKTMPAQRALFWNHIFWPNCVLQVVVNVDNYEFFDMPVFCSDIIWKSFITSNETFLLYIYTCTCIQ